MSIINSYDDSEEIVKAENFTKELKRLPEIAIGCFKQELIEYLKNNKDYKEYSDMLVVGEPVNFYKTHIGEKEVVVYRTIMGAPTTVSMMEEIHSRGVNKFVFFGSCGQLTNNLKKGALIIPTEAYRDEGTSYHYVPESDFIKIETAPKLAEIFEKNNIDYQFTKTWTTDAFYRETVNKAKNRVSLGCDVVDMECSAIMAMAKKRNIDAYQFLYTEDSLVEEEWDINELADEKTDLLKKCLDISLKIAKEI